MKKVSIVLSSPTIVQLQAGAIDAIVDNGCVYVPLISAGLPTGGEPVTEAAPTKAATKPAAPVAAKAASPAAPAPVAAAPAPAAKPAAPAPVAKPAAQQEENEIPAEQFESLEAGTNVTVVLGVEEFKGKAWSAEVVEFKEGSLFVRFHEDNQVDKLIPEEGDKVYTFGLNI